MSRFQWWRKLRGGYWYRFHNSGWMVATKYDHDYFLEGKQAEMVKGILFLEDWTK